MVEGECIKRQQMTALARKIRNPDSIAIIYLRRNQEEVWVSGDQAWDLLFPPVTAYLKKIFKKFQIDSEAVNECTARTWFNIVRHFASYNPGSFENEAHFLCWVQFIARNQAFKFFREKKEWHKRHPETISGLDPDGNQGVIAVDPVGTPLDLAAFRDESFYNVLKFDERIGFKLLLVEWAFERLPEKARNILVAVDQENKSYQEVAAVQGVKVPALKSVIFRARRQVMTMFGTFSRIIPVRPLYPSEQKRIESHRQTLVKILEMAFQG